MLRLVPQLTTLKRTAILAVVSTLAILIAVSAVATSAVAGLYRDEIDHPDTTDRGLAEFSVLKKRQLGEHVGTIRRLVWVGESYGDYTYQSRPLVGQGGKGP